MTEDTERILERLSELERKLSVRADQIRSDLDDLIKRIGSDQSEKERPVMIEDRIDQGEVTAAGNNEKWLVDYALRLGVNIGGLDLRGISRNIDWFRSHQDTIRYPEAYMKKMIAGCGPKTGFSVSRPARENAVKIDEPKEDEGMIMGVKKEEVEDKMIYWDLQTYKQIRPKLEPYGKMFQTYESCSESLMKKRVAVAIAIKEGVL